MSSNLTEDAELALDKLTSREVQLIKETEEVFKRQVEHIKGIDRLQTLRPNMTKINVDIKQLSSLVDSSYSLVDEVCSKFRRIDLAKARLQDCLSKISDIHDLRSCRIGMLKAMESDNFEEAAIHIKRFLEIDQKELRKTIAVLCRQRTDSSITVPQKQVIRAQDLMVNKDDDGTEYVIEPSSMDSTITKLEEARSRLLQICEENMTKAIQENNSKDVERFFKIFPMLNEYQGGLTSYAEFICRKIVTPQVAETLKSSQKNQADKLAALYESVAKLIDAHQPLIETYYGPGHLIVVVKIMLKECDRISRKLLEEFRNVRKLQSITNAILAASNQKLVPQNSVVKNRNSNLPNTSPLPDLDPRNIDSVLNEMASIISRSEVYLNFLVQRMKDDLGLKCDDDTQKQSSNIQIYQLISIECELNYLIQELGGIHVLFERFYLEESSKIAVQVDKIDSQTFSYFVSSMLDDIFFIIKKSTKRAISTKSNEVFCAIINHCVQLLESTFCQHLEDKLKNQQYYSTAFSGKNLDLSQAYSAIQNSRYLQSSTELETSKAQYFSALNNLDLACDYVQTLRGILDQDVKRLQSPLVSEQNYDNQVEKSITCLNELTKLVGKFTSMINTSLYQLFNAIFRNRLRSELRTILNENPVLASDLSKNPDGAIRLARDLLSSLDRSLHTSLTPENYSKLVSITKEFFISYIKSPR